jgi:hypothetical protein
MSFTTEIEIRRCELRAKEIFAKPTITDADAQLGKHLIEKWKRLTGWIERTELPILIN